MLGLKGFPTTAGICPASLRKCTVELNLKCNRKVAEKELRAIAKWVVVNQRDEYGNTALHIAAWNGAKKAFMHLLEEGADLVGCVNQSRRCLDVLADLVDEWPHMVFEVMLPTYSINIGFGFYFGILLALVVCWQRLNHG